MQGHDLMKLIATAINSVDLRLHGEFVKATEASLARDLCLIVAKPELESTVIYQKTYACQERLNFSVLL